VRCSRTLAIGSKLHSTWHNHQHQHHHYHHKRKQLHLRLYILQRNQPNNHHASVLMGALQPLARDWQQAAQYLAQPSTSTSSLSSQT
jgi:hypothetical protein